MKDYNWNVAYRMFMEIKRCYISKFGEENLYQQEEPIALEFGVKKNNVKVLTCIEYWVDKLNIEKYRKLIEPLDFKQNGTNVIVKYKEFGKLFANSSDFKMETFWEIHDGFYTECRGLVIDVKEEEIVNCPFRKFRNFDESEEYSSRNIIKRIEKAECVEFSDKLDGSMISSSVYKEDIIISSSGSLNIKESKQLTCAEEEILKNGDCIEMIYDNPEYTFIFELISADDPHIVVYKKAEQGIFLVGARNKFNGKIVSYRELIRLAELYNVRVTTVVEKTLTEILTDTDLYKSSDKEGFVLNIDGWLVKIKCNDYIGVSKELSLLLSPNTVIRAIANNMFDDYISKVPEGYKKPVMKTVDIVFEYIHYMESNINFWFDLAPKSSRKEFMLFAQEEVPKEFRAFVIRKFIGEENINFLKTNSVTNSPRYKILDELVIK